MADAEAWRKLGHAFAAAAARDAEGHRLAALYHGIDDFTGHGVVRGWDLSQGTAETLNGFKRLASEGAVLLGYLERDDGWTDWLSSLYREPRLEERINRRGFLRGGCNIPDVCGVSAAYCELLASAEALPPLAPMDLRWEWMSGQHLRRASWLRAVLAQLRLTPQTLQRDYHGPHLQTTTRILTGHVVSESVLNKLARALTAAGHPTTVRDIPLD